MDLQFYFLHVGAFESNVDDKRFLAWQVSYKTPTTTLCNPAYYYIMFGFPICI